MPTQWNSGGRLVALQVATLLLQMTAMVAALLLYRHYTDDWFVPLPDYLLSLKPAVPAVATLFASYIAMIVTGQPLTGAGKALLAFARNVFFQSVRLMLVCATACACVVALAAIVVLNVTPPAYERVVTELLGGESDRHENIGRTVTKLRPVNPELADLFSLAHEVFRTRAQVNFEGVQPRAQILYRALEARKEWRTHPLALHALGEAYSLAGAAARAVDHARATKFLDQSRSCYAAVAMSGSPLATELLRASARNNIGNQFWYEGRWGDAAAAWRTANSRTNLSSWGNLISAYVAMGSNGMAVAEAEGARAWAERSGKALLEATAYSSIPANAAVASWMMDDAQRGLEFAREAMAVNDDTMNRLNYAFGLLAAGDTNACVSFLRRQFAPVDPPSLPSWFERSAEDYGAQLIFALAEPGASRLTQVARLSAFLREQRTTAEIALLAETGATDLVALVHAKGQIGGDHLCGDLLATPPGQERLREVAARLAQSP